MTSIPKPAAPAESFTATYDAWNRQVKLEEDDGQSGLRPVQENAYDGRNYRTVRKTYANGTLDETRHFFYSAQWQALEERLGTETDPDRQFVWGLRYIDDLALRDRDTTDDGTLDERLYALQDANCNMTAAASTGGDVQERYAYQPYGQPLFLDRTYASRSASSFAWETLFAGYRWDQNIQLYPVRNRNLHSLLGVWGSRDPLGYFDGLNRYLYARDCPTTLVDPEGLQGLGFPGPVIGGTRWKGSLGCFPVFGPVCLCIVYDISVNVTYCECKKICVILHATIEAGLFACGTVAPQFPKWPPRIKALPIGPGGLKWPVPNFPFVHGVMVGCHPEGCKGVACVTGSIGIGGWFIGATVGCQYCYYPSSGQSTIKCGTNIGAGTGVSVGGGITCTWCA